MGMVGIGLAGLGGEVQGKCGLGARFRFRYEYVGSEEVNMCCRYEVVTLLSYNGFL
jgi:hypothetical protein